MYRGLAIPHCKLTKVLILEILSLCSTIVFCSPSGQLNVVSVFLTALGIGPVDEDVDIGGSEAPVTSYPPVHIDRDTGGRAEECNEAG